LKNTDDDFIKCYQSCRAAGNSRFWCQHTC
jgi:hypothetical protein